MLFRLRAALLCPLVVMLFGCTPEKPAPGPTPSVSVSVSVSASASAEPSPSTSPPAGPTPSDEPPPSGATPSPSLSDGAEPVLWPYPKACVETSVDDLQGYNAEPLAQVYYFRGKSRPCAGTTPTKGGRLAVTQYHQIDGKTAGWMGAPWPINSTGSLGWSRTGELPGSVTALCLSTGLERRDGKVHAQHDRCLRPTLDPEIGGWSGWTEVPVQDPTVTGELQRWPAPGDTAPPGCRNCFVTDPAAELPPPDASSLGPTAPTCAVADLDRATLDGKDVELQGRVKPCAPDDATELYLSSVRYTADVGDLGRTWTPADEDAPDPHSFTRSGHLDSDVQAICIINGLEQTDDGLRGHHLLCLAVQGNADGSRTLVPIPVTDSRVTKPVDTLDDGYPGGPCGSCV